MTPTRFRDCLRTIRWTSIDIVNALHCDLAWIEALETGEIGIPEDIAVWLEKLASFHAANQPPETCRAAAAHAERLPAGSSPVPA